MQVPAGAHRGTPGVSCAELCQQASEPGSAWAGAHRPGRGGSARARGRPPCHRSPGGAGVRACCSVAGSAACGDSPPRATQLCGNITQVLIGTSTANGPGGGGLGAGRARPALPASTHGPCAGNGDPRGPRRGPAQPPPLWPPGPGQPGRSPAADGAWPGWLGHGGSRQAPPGEEAGAADVTVPETGPCSSQVAARGGWCPSGSAALPGRVCFPSSCSARPRRWGSARPPPGCSPAGPWLGAPGGGGDAWGPSRGRGRGRGRAPASGELLAAGRGGGAYMSQQPQRGSQEVMRPQISTCLRFP